MSTGWAERWPPERRVAFIRDELPDEAISAIFEVMILEDGGEA